jgi:spermidine/putrescine transport system substrate-binding protein
MDDSDLRVLAGPTSAERLTRLLTRRRFLGLAGLGTAGLALLAACGGEAAGSSGDPRSSPTNATGVTSTSAVAGSDPTMRHFNLYTWAAYDDPDLMKRFGHITVDVYNSNEEAVAKLEAIKAVDGYDIVVPTGPYIPQLVAHDLLQPLDRARLPNFDFLQTRYRDQPFDLDNRYSVCKDIGSTGWIYDNTVVKTPIRTWSDFMRAAQKEASGQTSLLDVAPDVCGIYFWANGVDWTTEDPAALDSCEDVIVNELAPHVKAFTSYPGVQLAQETYVLSQVFNGDARQGLLSVDDPSRYTWRFGGPKSEFWMDNWCILRNAKNVDAAYNFINFILDPRNSATDLAFHGYDTGVTGVRERLPSNTKFLDMVFFTPEVLASLVPGKVNSAQTRQQDILAKAKARAGT